VKRFYAVLVALIGVAILAMGIVFIMQSNTGKQTVADEISPITLSDLNAKYDAVKAKQQAAMIAEEPNIQAGKAAPSVLYDYLSAQRGLLGLAKSNMSLAGFVLMNGVVEVVLGIGLIFTGMLLYMKPAA
jgi:uncharacterized membrane protein